MSNVPLSVVPQPSLVKVFPLHAMGHPEAPAVTVGAENRSRGRARALVALCFVLCSVAVWSEADPALTLGDFHADRAIAAYRGSGGLDPALEARRAIAYSSGHPEARAVLALVGREQATAERIPALLGVIPDLPSDSLIRSDVVWNAARLLVRVGRFSEAWSLIEGFELRSGVPDRTLLAVRSLAGLGREGEASALLTSAVSAMPTSDALQHELIYRDRDYLREGFLEWCMSHRGALPNLRCTLAAAVLLSDDEETAGSYYDLLARSDSGPLPLEAEVGMVGVHGDPTPDEVSTLIGQGVFESRRLTLELLRRVRVQPARGMLLRALDSFTGTTGWDENRDGYEEIVVDYRDGDPTRYARDMNQDEVYELEATYRECMPSEVKVRAGSHQYSLRYSTYPTLSVLVDTVLNSQGAGVERTEWRFGRGGGPTLAVEEGILPVVDLPAWKLPEPPTGARLLADATYVGYTGPGGELAVEPRPDGGFHVRIFADPLELDVEAEIRDGAIETIEQRSEEFRLTISDSFSRDNRLPTVRLIEHNGLSIRSDFLQGEEVWTTGGDSSFRVPAGRPPAVPGWILSRLGDMGVLE